MADVSTTFNPTIADFLAKYLGADGSEPTVQVVSSGGDSTTSLELSMSTGLSEDGAESTLSANVEAEINGTPITATADATASGETASTLLNMEADLSEDLAKVEVEAEAGATGDEATATANTDVSPESAIDEQATVEMPGDDGITVESRTYAEFDPSLFEVSLDEPMTSEPSLALEETSQESTLIDTGGWLLQ